MYFAPGETVLHQMPHVDESGAGGPPVISDVKPMLVIEDSAEVTQLFLPAGTATKLSLPVPRDRPKPWRPGEWELVDSVWSRWNAVFLMRPDDWHAVWVWWTPDWQFLGWYVNLQEPFVRKADGFWVRDLQLDVVVGADRSWRWKDVEDLKRCVELGVISAPIAERARREATEIVGRIEAGAEPFTDRWRDWRPPSEWEVPLMDPGQLGGQFVEWRSAI